LIYLASPYSHTDKRIEQWRYQAVLNYTIRQQRLGVLLFSPIVYGHPFAQAGLPSDFTYWRTLNERLILGCSCLHYYMLPGWEDSIGVKAEIEFAESYGLEVEAIEYD